MRRLSHDNERRAAADATRFDGGAELDVALLELKLRVGDRVVLEAPSEVHENRNQPVSRPNPDVELLICADTPTKRQHHAAFTQHMPETCTHHPIEP